MFGFPGILIWPAAAHNWLLTEIVGLINSGVPTANVRRPRKFSSFCARKVSALSIFVLQNYMCIFYFAQVSPLRLVVSAKLDATWATSLSATPAPTVTIQAEVRSR